MSQRGAVQAVQACPCGSGRTYTQCCAPLHQGRALPASAEALMRSRYTAYVRRLETYLLATWAPETRPTTLDLAGEDACKWLGLEVRRHVATGPDTAEVSFVARYRVGGRGQRMQETSRFRRESDGRWLYIDGELS